jgi:hypothetical protein
MKPKSSKLLPSYPDTETGMFHAIPACTLCRHAVFTECKCIDCRACRVVFDAEPGSLKGIDAAGLYDLSERSVRGLWMRRSHTRNGRCAPGQMMSVRGKRDKYGMAERERADLLYRQGGRCAITGEPLTPKNFAVDHNHATGEVRGFLTRKANSALGMLGDDPDAVIQAANYLKERGHYGG